jgi:hypothetical protein
LERAGSASRFHSRKTFFRPVLNAGISLYSSANEQSYRYEQYLFRLWHDISPLKQADESFLLKMTKLDPPQADLKQSYIDALQWYQEMHPAEEEEEAEEATPLFEVEEVLDMKIHQVCFV